MIQSLHERNQTAPLSPGYFSPFFALQPRTPRSSGRESATADVREGRRTLEQVDAGVSWRIPHACLSSTPCPGFSDSTGLTCTPPQVLSNIRTVRQFSAEIREKERYSGKVRHVHALPEERDLVAPSGLRRRRCLRPGRGGHEDAPGAAELDALSGVCALMTGIESQPDGYSTTQQSSNLGKKMDVFIVFVLNLSARCWCSRL